MHAWQTLKNQVLEDWTKIVTLDWCYQTILCFSLGINTRWQFQRQLQDLSASTFAHWSPKYLSIFRVLKMLTYLFYWQNFSNWSLKKEMIGQMRTYPILWKRNSHSTSFNNCKISKIGMQKTQLADLFSGFFPVFCNKQKNVKGVLCPATPSWFRQYKAKNKFEFSHDNLNSVHDRIPWWMMVESDGNGNNLIQQHIMKLVLCRLSLLKSLVIHFYNWAFREMKITKVIFPNLGLNFFLSKKKKINKFPFKSSYNAFVNVFFE